MYEKEIQGKLGKIWENWEYLVGNKRFVTVILRGKFEIFEETFGKI